MRMLVMIAAVCGVGAMALLAQSKFTPLNIKTGLWQDTLTTTMSGSLALPPGKTANLTPEQRAQFEAAMKQYVAGHQGRATTHKSCLTRKELNENPIAGETKAEGGTKCKAKLIRSTSSDAEVEETCTDEEEGGTSVVHMIIHAVDQEHVTGKGHVTTTMGGHTMKSDVQYKSQWLQTSCPAGVD
jgi:hypothetical protein